MAASTNPGSGICRNRGMARSNRCASSELACAFVLHAVPASELPAVISHFSACPECRRELDSLRPLVDRFVAWPTDILAPPAALQARLALRIASDTGEPSVQPAASDWSEPEWEPVAPGIECKLLATDAERQRVSMLVRLAPGASYPAHIHHGAEDLHLLDGELWIDGRGLLPGDFNFGAPGAGDDSVNSRTGCTCLLVTSTRDILR